MVGIVTSSYDEKEISCPMLGHLISFAYCRNIEGHACRRIVACWESRVDIHAFLAGFYSQEEIVRLTAPPQPKVNQLLALIEKAKQRR